MVFRHASPLTRFRNSRLKLDSYEDRKTTHALWLETFDLNWPKGVKYLPETHAHLMLQNVDLGKVRSRSMYESLCQRFPKATEANAEFAKIDKNVEKHKCRNKVTIPSSSDMYKSSTLRLLHIPMRHMWLGILGDTLDKFPYARAVDCIIEGHIDLLHHLIDTGRVDLSRITIIRKDVYEGFVYYHAMDIAAREGHLDILKMLHETGCQKTSTMAMDDAASNGHLDVVKWLHENRDEGCTTFAMNCASRNGHLDVVKWLHENRTEGCTMMAMDGAAKNWHPNVVRFLLNNRTEGFSDNALINCTSTEIIQMLVASLSSSQMHDVMEKQYLKHDLSMD